MKRALWVVVFLLLAAAIVGAQSITVVKPASGEILRSGGGYTIVWTKTGTMPDQVRITLRNAQTLAEVWVIRDGAPNTGSFAWQMPEFDAGAYVIRVKVKGANIHDDSEPFTIAAQPTRVAPRPRIDQGPIALKFPALSISGVTLRCDLDAFVITFAYKNSGTGPLPKASAMPVKPDFRVIIDNKEVNRGSLFIPAFEAPPGWELPTFFACEVKMNPIDHWDETWKLGHQLVIEINNNKVNGMASDSKNYDLRELALGCAFDAYINGATYDWDKEMLNVSVRVDGAFPPARTLKLFNYRPATGGEFIAQDDLVPGQHYYAVSHKLRNYLDWTQHTFEVWLWIHVYAPGSEYPDRRDINHPNQFMQHFTFNR
jgi:hypothetical protein